jgi:hypothetical protein
MDSRHPPLWIIKLRSALLDEVRAHTPDHDAGRCTPLDRGFPGLCAACRSTINRDISRFADAIDLSDIELSLIIMLLGLRSLPALALVDAIDRPELRVVPDEDAPPAPVTIQGLSGPIGLPRSLAESLYALGEELGAGEAHYLLRAALRGQGKEVAHG